MKKTNKTKCKHANTYGKETNNTYTGKWLSQGIQQETPFGKGTRQETPFHVGDKRKDMQADPAQSPSAKTSTKRCHAGDKCQEMQTNSLQNGPRPPEADTMQETPVKCKEIKAPYNKMIPKGPAADTVRETNEETMQTQCKTIQPQPMHPATKIHAGDKESKPAHWKMMSPRHPAEQSSGRQIKRNERKPWPNDPAKASSKASMWEANEKKCKQTCGKTPRPRHPAKQPCGRQMVKK